MPKLTSRLSGRSLARVPRALAMAHCALAMASPYVANSLALSREAMLLTAAVAILFHWRTFLPVQDFSHQPAQRTNH